MEKLDKIGNPIEMTFDMKEGFRFAKCPICGEHPLITRHYNKNNEACRSMAVCFAAHDPYYVMGYFKCDSHLIIEWNKKVYSYSETSALDLINQKIDRLEKLLTVKVDNDSKNS